MRFEAQGQTSRGFVSIVGAGPGPADLMTLRALDRLQRAEVVVHDRLIAPEVLALIPEAAQRVYVGKALGNHAVPQEGIHDLLNVLALIKGEVDLAVERAHSAVDAFYLRYPEFRQ